MADTESTGDRLQIARVVLQAEGFTSTVFQVVKSGQRFGLVKQLDSHREMHVRGFEDGSLEAETEVGRDYLQHLDDRFRADASRELNEILTRHGISVPIRRTSFPPDPSYPGPKGVVAWKTLLAGVLAGVGAMLLRRRRRGRGSPASRW